MSIKKNLKIIFAVIGVIWSTFQLYTGMFGVLSPLQQRSIHVTFALVLAFLVTPYKKHKPKKEEEINFQEYEKDHIDVEEDRINMEQIILALLSLAIGGYIAVNHYAIWSGPGSFTTAQLIIAGLGMLLVLEATRRVTGWGLPIIAGVFFLYQLAGPYMPWLIRHRGISFTKAIAYQFFSTEGVFGTAVDVSASFIFLFILYARFLQVSGSGQVFIDLAASLVGSVRGGSAKIAVVASCFFGSISGSAVANVAGTGSFTIPLMKKHGYPPYFAGAVEAVASSGGQFMPPIMGSSAFLMAEILSIPYWKVALYAAVPAILYYLAIFFMVDFRAAKENLIGMPKSERPKTWQVLKKGWLALISPAVLIVLLAFLQWSPGKAAVWAIVVTIVASMFSPELRITPTKLYKALSDGALGAVDTALACGAIGIVIGSVMQTGLALKLSSILTTLAGSNLFLLLLLAMITSLILGMGLPTVACYLVLAVMVGPALIKMGVVPIAAHLFIFYFGIISAITPPVALAAYVGAGIAGSSFVQTGLIACKLGLSAFILPFMFVYNPALILQGKIVSTIICVITATIGIFALSAALEGYMLNYLSKWERVIFGFAAILLIIPEFYTDCIGITIFLIMTWRHIRITRAGKQLKIDAAD